MRASGNRCWLLLHFHSFRLMNDDGAPCDAMIQSTSGWTCMFAAAVQLSVPRSVPLRVQLQQQQTNISGIYGCVTQGWFPCCTILSDHLRATNLACLVYRAIKSSPEPATRCPVSKETGLDTSEVASLFLPLHLVLERADKKYVPYWHL